MSESDLPTPPIKWLFVILGTTGSGKTKLSIELAEALARNMQIRAEVVSADSMQLYRQIDVLSAKASLEEQARVKHHLLDITDMSDTSFSVQDYQRLAKKTISSIFEANSIPILAGGTNYYIESVIWESKYEFSVDEKPLDPDLKAELEKLDDVALHARLALVDAPRAELLHPKVRRKVMRSLEIYYGTKRRHSDWLREQQEKARFQWENTAFFWVSCASPDVLESRLNSRVDDMVSHGLKEELKLIANTFQSQGQAMDWSRGALQSIGLREFRSWIESFQKNGSDDEKEFLEAIEQVKLHTRQYSKAQVSWIRNGLLPVAPVVFRFDSSEVEKWSEKVLSPATMIATMLIQGHDREDILTTLTTRYPETVDVLTPSNKEKVEKAWKKYVCECCQRTLNGEAEWTAHQKSRGHKAAKRRHSKSQSLNPNAEASSPTS